MSKTTAQTETETVDAVPVDDTNLPAVVRHETLPLSRLDDDERQAIALFLEQMENVTDDDPEVAALRIIGRVLAAQTIDEILSEPRVVGARTMLGVPVELRSVRFGRSDYDGSPGYALLECTDLTNDEPVLITCGASQVMAQAWKLHAIGALPCPVELRETAKATRGGFHPMFLRPAVPKAVPGATTAPLA